MVQTSSHLSAEPVAILEGERVTSRASHHNVMALGVSAESGPRFPFLDQGRLRERRLVADQLWHLEGGMLRHSGVS